MRNYVNVHKRQDIHNYYVIFFSRDEMHNMFRVLDVPAHRQNLFHNTYYTILAVMLGIWYFNHQFRQTETITITSLPVMWRLLAPNSFITISINYFQAGVVIILIWLTADDFTSEGVGIPPGKGRYYVN